MRLNPFQRGNSDDASGPGGGGGAGDAGASALSKEALELAQELLHGLEQFVLSTPDLDAPRFLERIRRTAAELTPSIDPAQVSTHRRWVVDALPTFGQLQRRYLAEREEELWRLLKLYQNHDKIGGTANQQFHEVLRASHERMTDAVRLDDLRQVREQLENEIERVGAIVDEKERTDKARAEMLETQVRQLEAALVAARHEAVRDPLTGVLHRGGFEAELEAALTAPNPCSLAVIDVDNFKGINDTLGHLVGDEILKMAVQLLGRLTRPGDTIGRFGGDEFVLLVPGLSPERLGDRLDGHARPRNIQFNFDERLCSVKFSMSIGVAGSIGGDTPATLIKRADEALYEAKRNGKAQARVAPTPKPQAA
jgi:diguanylate cyclase (GGDEF)-like protein